MTTRISAQLKFRLSTVRLLTLDVDGVLTDGGLYYTGSGDVMRRFCVHDGFGIQQVMRAGIAVAFVTRSATSAISARAHALGITRCLDGVEDKVAAVSSLCDELGIGLEEVAHMGDDLNDLSLLKLVGVAATVADPAEEVGVVAHWRSSKQGGGGAVREFCDALLHSRRHPVIEAESLGGLGRLTEEPGSSP